MNFLWWLDFAQASGDISGNGSIQEREGVSETQEVFAPSRLPIRVNLFDLFALHFWFDTTFLDSEVWILSLFFHVWQFSKTLVRTTSITVTAL